MFYCTNCKKDYPEDNNFCLLCGSPLVEMQDHSEAKPQEREIPVQRISKAEPAAIKGMGKKTKKGAAAVIGMFLVNLIPLLGFLFSFVWARTKFKSSKIKLTAITSALIVFNISITILGYAAAVSLMKNSLANTAKKLNDTSTIQQGESLAAIGSVGTATDYPVITSKPLTDYITPSEEIIPGDNEMTHLQNGKSDVLPHEDEHGNSYVDIDHDGFSDAVYCPDGIVLPVKGTKITEDGGRYIDNNEDGNYEIFYGIDGSMYADNDENGTYEVLIDLNGNIYYDNNGDGVYEETYEAEYGQG